MKQHIINHLYEHQKALDYLQMSMVEQIEETAILMANLLLKGNKILLMGNGGSAADAQHFAAELVGRFLAERRPLPAIALTTDTSILTAVGNDYGFGQVFKRQVAALAQPGDLVVGISTSGNSPNVLDALKAADANGSITLALVGHDGGEIAKASSHSLCIPSQYTPAIQEAHIVIIHMLCNLIEKKMFGGGARKQHKESGPHA